MWNAKKKKNIWFHFEIILLFRKFFDKLNSRWSGQWLKYKHLNNIIHLPTYNLTKLSPIYNDLTFEVEIYVGNYYINWIDVQWLKGRDFSTFYSVVYYMYVPHKDENLHRFLSAYINLFEKRFPKSKYQM